MKIMPQVQCLEDCLNVFSIAFRLCATLPFDLVKSNTGRRVAIRGRHALRRFAEMAVIYAVILYGQKVRYGMIDGEDGVTYLGVVAMYTTAVAVALATSLTLYFKQEHLIKAGQIMQHIDSEIEQIGVHVSYSFWLKMGFLTASLVLSVPVVFYTSNEALSEKIFDALAYYYSAIVRCTALSIPMIYMGVVHERFQQLNNTLNKLDDDDDDDDDDDCTFDEIQLKKELLNKLSPAFILDKVTTLHASLIEASKACFASYSLILLMNVVTGIVQSTLTLMFMYIGNHEKITIVELIFSFAVFNGQMLIFGLLSYFIKNEAKNTLTTLGHLNIYYFDQKLAFKKNTLLLQGLHNKVDFSICGMFPWNANILLKQFNVCKNIILLILQHFYKVGEQAPN